MSKFNLLAYILPEALKRKQQTAPDKIINALVLVTHNLLVYKYKTITSQTKLYYNSLVEHKNHFVQTYILHLDFFQHLVEVFQQ